MHEIAACFCWHRIDHVLDVLISKSMSYMLRHGLDKLEHSPAGWVTVQNLLASPVLCRYTEEDIRRVVLRDSKGRYQLQETPEGPEVRATQGHGRTAGIDPEAAFEVITSSEALGQDMIVHGTYLNCLESIMKTGLKPMSRLHVHFALDERGCKSGARENVEALVWVSVDRVLRAGIPIYKAANDVILTGSAVPTRCILAMKLVSDGLEIYNPEIYGRSRTGEALTSADREVQERARREQAEDDRQRAEAKPKARPRHLMREAMAIQAKAKAKAGIIRGTVRQAFVDRARRLQLRQPEVIVIDPEPARGGRRGRGDDHRARDPWVHRREFRDEFGYIHTRFNQLRIGKDTHEYYVWANSSERDRARCRTQPQEPDPYADDSKRRFLGRVSAWRRDLHHFENEMKHLMWNAEWPADWEHSKWRSEPHGSRGEPSWKRRR